NKMEIKSIIIENSKRNYGLYEQQLIEYFGLQYIPDPCIGMNILKRYSGTYHNQEMNFSLNIELIDDHLYIFGNRKLKAKNKNQFYLDDIGVTVEFIKEDNEIN